MIEAMERSGASTGESRRAYAAGVSSDGDEDQRLYDRAALDFGKEVRRGAQTLGEAVGHVLSRLALLHLVEKLAAQELGIGRRDGFTQLREGSPIHAHGFGGGSLVTTLPSVTGSASTMLCGANTGMTAIDAHDRATAMTAGWRNERHIAFEQPVAPKLAPLRAQTEHCPAQPDGIAHSYARAFHVFDDVGQPGGVEHFTHRVDQERRALSARRVTQIGIALTRRRSMDRLERAQEVHAELQAIGLDELEWIPRLRPNIDANDIEAGAMIAHAGATSAAEQVKETWTRHLPLPDNSLSHHGIRGGGGGDACELKVGVRADGFAAHLAAGHVVQSADAEIKRQAAGERVGEGHLQPLHDLDGDVDEAAEDDPRTRSERGPHEHQRRAVELVGEGGHAATRWRRGLALLSSIASNASTKRISGFAAVSLRETDACVIPNI